MCQPDPNQDYPRTASSITITNYTCISQTQTKTNSEWANHVGCMLLGSLETDADATVVVVPC